MPPLLLNGVGILVGYGNQPGTYIARDRPLICTSKTRQVRQMGEIRNKNHGYPPRTHMQQEVMKGFRILESSLIDENTTQTVAMASGIRGERTGYVGIPVHAPTTVEHHIAEYLWPTGALVHPVPSDTSLILTVKAAACILGTCAPNGVVVVRHKLLRDLSCRSGLLVSGGNLLAGTARVVMGCRTADPGWRLLPCSAAQAAQGGASV